MASVSRKKKNNTFLAWLTIYLLMMSISATTSAQTCNSHRFPNNELYKACNDLPVLNSFLHWNYDPSFKNVEIAYRQPVSSSSSSWAAWAVNPTGTGMVGSQAFVAYKQPDGTMRAYTSPIHSYRTMLEEGSLSFHVSDLSAVYINDEITIFATFQLPGNSTTINQLWQNGPVHGNTLLPHEFSDSNLQSMGTVDLLSGQVVASKSTGAEESRIRMRNVHGVINAITWGMMMPFGAMIARYLKFFNSASPAWFYIHVTCQSLAYLVGIAGFVTGIILGSKAGVHHTLHRNIGISLMCLATLQVFALIARPKPEHKLRKYWTLYHQLTGYATIVLSILNVFKGLGILGPDQIWKTLYYCFIGVLAGFALGLEAYTWYIVLARKKLEDEAKDVPPTEENETCQPIVV